MTESPTRVAFVGLGKMGLPMAIRLQRAGYVVCGADPAQEARDAFAVTGGLAHLDARDAVREAGVVILMLPDSGVVRRVLFDEQGIASLLAPTTLVIDMSSSDPIETRRIAAGLKELGVAFLDAPVSGGVKRAIDGTLAIMVGGDDNDAARAMPVLTHLGRDIFRTGAIGSGHAVKALNNYVSAAGLVAACEAALVAGHFGVNPAILVDVLNASTGRNNATENKMKPFVLSGRFNSGFALALMSKDLSIAAALARAVGIDAAGVAAAAALWERAASQLGSGADHTEIARVLGSHSASLSNGQKPEIVN